MIGQLNVTVRFPDRTVEHITLSQAPKVDSSIGARDEMWRVTRVRLPWGLYSPGEVVYDIDVEPASLPPATT
jgi:hypothetical protein